MPWIFTDEMRFYLHEGESLLDGMLRPEHKDVRYMCQQGFCGACKMRVKAATEYPKTKQIPLAHLDDDEVLACCCMPTGTMVVSYDADKSDTPCQYQHKNERWHLQKTAIITRQIFSQTHHEWIVHVHKVEAAPCQQSTPADNLVNPLTVRVYHPQAILDKRDT